MDNLTQEGASPVNRKDLFSAMRFTMQDVGRRLIGFFKLNEEDQLKAGVDLGYEGLNDKSVHSDSSSI